MNTRTYQSLNGTEIKTILENMLDQAREIINGNPQLRPYLSWPQASLRVDVTVVSPDVLKPVAISLSLGPINTPDDVRIANALPIPELTQTSAGITEKRSKRSRANDTEEPKDADTSTS